jgi:hypothetical protein
VKLVADQSLSDVFFSAWCRHAELCAAARRTAEAPGRRETVELGAHSIKHEIHPRIEVQLDGQRVAELPITLVVGAAVRACCVRVAFGKAWEVISGEAEVTVELVVGQAPPWRSKSKVDLPGTLRLGDGLNLA